MAKDDRKLRGVALSLLAGFVYGIAAVLTRVGLVNFDSPIVGAGIAFFAGMVIMLPPSVRGLGSGIRGNHSDVIYVTASGVLSAAGIMAYYAAMSTTPVSVVTSITSANPLATILLAHVFFNRMERITKRVVIGAVIVVVGVAVVAIGRSMT